MAGIQPLTSVELDCGKCEHEVDAPILSVFVPRIDRKLAIVAVVVAKERVEHVSHRYVFVDLDVDLGEVPRVLQGRHGPDVEGPSRFHIGRRASHVSLAYVRTPCAKLSA